MPPLAVWVYLFAKAKFGVYHSVRIYPSLSMLGMQAARDFPVRQRVGLQSSPDSYPGLRPSAFSLQFIIPFKC